MLIANNISKTYENEKIIDKVSLSIKAGEMTVLIGPSGGGKSTLLRILSMLTPPDEGEIILNDNKYKFPLPKNINEISPRPWPELTAVFQQLFLWPHMTLRENIIFPALNILNEEEAKKELDELIELFDMASFIDKYPNETSGGQRQRAAIARALILQPSYIMLDEVTSALDIEQAAKVLDILKKLKKKNISILLITHHVNFAKDVANQIIFLDKGKIIESGGAEILIEPKNKRLKQFLSIIESTS